MPTVVKPPSIVILRMGALSSWILELLGRM
jgi:hypothetical protein